MNTLPALVEAKHSVSLIEEKIAEFSYTIVDGLPFEEPEEPEESSQRGCTIEFDADDTYEDAWIVEYADNPKYRFSIYLGTEDDDLDRNFVILKNGAIKECSLACGEEGVLSDVSDEDMSELSSLMQKANDMHQTTSRELAERKAISRVASLEAVSSLTPLGKEPIAAIMREIDTGTYEADEALDIIKNYGLEPVATQQLSKDLSVHYSKIATFEEGSAANRLAVIAYLQTNAGIKPVIYYLSNSQAVWRYLPFHEVDMGRIDHYGKGKDESGILLPTAVQQSLAELGRDTAIKMSNFYGQYLFQLLSPEGPEEATDIQFQDETHLLIDWHRTLGMEELEDQYSSGPRTPEELVIDPSQPGFSPDYSKATGSWIQTGTMYGDVTVTTVPSRDKMLNYLYMQDQAGRTWIGGIEDITAPIRPNGLRQGYVVSGLATMPAYEYESQAGSVARESDDRRHGNYVDMSSFLARMALIKDFKEHNTDN